MTEVRATSSDRKLRVSGGVVSAVAGLFHLPVGIIGLADPRMTGTIFGEDAVLVVPAFFLLLGAFQLLWAWITVTSGNELIGIGIFAFLASIILYLFALATPLPFGVIQQTISLPGALTKVVEAAYVVIALFLVSRSSQERL